MACAPWVISAIVVSVELIFHPYDSAGYENECIIPHVLTIPKMIENSLITVCVCAIMIVLYSLILQKIISQVSFRFLP